MGTAQTSNPDPKPSQINKQQVTYIHILRKTQNIYQFDRFFLYLSNVHWVEAFITFEHVLAMRSHQNWWYKICMIFKRDEINLMLWVTNFLVYRRLIGWWKFSATAWVCPWLSTKPFGPVSTSTASGWAPSYPIPQSHLYLNLSSQKQIDLPEKSFSTSTTYLCRGT